MQEQEPPKPSAPADEVRVVPTDPPPWFLRPPGRRASLLGLFLLTLPFVWGEHRGCNSSIGEEYTGFDFMFAEGSVGFALLVLLPTALGFAAFYTRRVGVRFAYELIACILAWFAAGGTAVAGLFGASGRSYPAPFIAALAMLATAIEAFVAAVLQFKALFVERRPEREDPKPWG